MRILQVIHQFLPKNVAGSEIYTFHLSQELARQGHHVTVLFAEIDPERPDYEVDKGSFRGLPIRRMVYNYRPRHFRDTFVHDEVEAVFRGVLRDVKPEVVHFQQLQSFSLSLPRLAQARSGVVFTLHEYGLLCPLWGQMIKADRTVCSRPTAQECTDCLGQSPFFGPLLAGDGGEDGPVSERRNTIREMVGFVDSFVAPSRFLKQQFVDHGFPEEKIVYSDYGFPLGSESEPRLLEGDRRLRFGYVGTLVPHKGIHVLLEAFASIPAELDFELRVYGDPTKAPDYLEGLRQRFADPRISWMGEFDPAQVREVYASLDVLVVPSIWYENSPLTIHEAFQLRIPVIASDFGGMAELLAEGGGLRFELGSPEGLRRGVESILENPGRLEEIRSSIPRVKPIESNAAEMLELYQRAVAGRSKGFLRRWFGGG